MKITHFWNTFFLMNSKFYQPFLFFHDALNHFLKNGYQITAPPLCLAPHNWPSVLNAALNVVVWSCRQACNCWEWGLDRRIDWTPSAPYPPQLHILIAWQRRSHNAAISVSSTLSLHVRLCVWNPRPVPFTLWPSLQTFVSFSNKTNGTANSQK